MKLRNYFLLSIVVGAVAACSSDEDIPEVHVFTPNATLSLAAGVYGDMQTKAPGTKGTTTEEEKEKQIHNLKVLVFTGTGEGAAYQTEKDTTNSEIVKDIPVEAGQATIVVLANTKLTDGYFKGKTLKDLLAHTDSLVNETLDGGLSMSSAVLSTNISINTHNIYGNAGDFSADEHSPSETKGGRIDLRRHVAQVNLKSVEVSGGATFDLKEVFVANVKGYSHLVTLDAANNLVETDTVPKGRSLWWYGDCAEDSSNSYLKTTKGGVLNGSLVSKPTGGFIELKPTNGNVASFYVYENRNNTPEGERTLLVLKGDYTKDGRTETDRYYTISVNDPAMEGSKLTEGEGDGKPNHNYIKRNYRYNVSVTITSNGSERPYDAKACMNVAVQVAAWNVIIQDENLD